jgi:DNA-binding NarL/FixJ family response regulator
MKKTVFIYGSSLAVLAFILKAIEYKWLIKDISWQFYIFIIALIFCTLGMWIGHKILHRVHPKQVFEINHQAIKSLGLSERELQVLQQILKGHSNQKIADELYISINTVKTHLKNSYAKLEVNNRILAIEKLKTLKIFKT